MNGLRIYNSYVRDKQLFEPLVPGYVGMYVCGPTVSGESHLGHARPYITFDIVYRYLMHLGYKVRYVRNITDAGHFEEEGREAEDKISKKAVIEKLEPMELVHKYTHLYHWAMDQFNNLPPSIEPTVTGHIVEQIEMIKGLIRSGYAYEVNGSVYFDVSKYAGGHDYGKLSGRVVEDLLQTTRELEGQGEKRNTADFALWKAAPPEHIMRWPSPWGEGFPGWHIECSAMATKYLGKQFDIHGGGMDLLFPHHESEIAQSTICNGVHPVRYWMHNNMITINGRKMGKSYNNVIKLTELFSGNHPLLEKAYSPMTVRFFILQTHYRSTLDFSNEGLQAAEKGLRRLMEAYGWLRKSTVDGPRTTEEKRETTDDKRQTTDEVSRLSSVDSRSDDEETPAQKAARLLDSFAEHMNDDFGMARVLAAMFELVPLINSLKDGSLTGADLPAELVARMSAELKVWIEDIFGLKEEAAAGGDELKAVMDILISIRKSARSRKDWVTSDSIRNDLEKAGILLKDEKNGEMSWTVK